MIPSIIIIQNVQISTLAFFVIAASILALYEYWCEIRRDGFDEEKALDLFITVLLTAVLFSRFIYAVVEGYDLETTFWHVLRFWTAGFNIFGAVVGFIISVLFFTRLWKWSFYRISDIFSLAFSLALVVIFFGSAVIYQLTGNVVISIWYLIVFVLLSKIRIKFRSGLVFSLFLVASFFVELKFYLILLIISLVNLYFRERKNPMAKKLPASFIGKMKQTLKRKDKELEVEQKLLLDEDPYMVEGRDADNEMLDDVQEDIAKREADLRLSASQQLQMRVKKALAKIKIGSYGICEVCGEPISMDRLKAYPEATTCVKHST